MNLIHLIVLCLALAVPPLTGDQKRQLDTASDDTPLLDEPAIYPLLKNATEWTSGDEAGATIPDFAAILEDPAAARGQLYLIESPYVGVLHQIKLTAQPGPWTQHAQAWGLLEKTGVRRSIVVILTNPGPPPAASNSDVRLVGRFFKVWHDSSDFNQKQFLVFVGHSARNVEAQSVRQGYRARNVGPMFWLVMTLAFVLAGATIWRYMVKSRLNEESAQREELDAARMSELEEEAANEPPLPEDPAEAMREMERRAKQRESGEN